MKKRVELIFSTGCPNVGAAREALRAAFAAAGLSPTWQEWNREARDCPGYARRFGSPTILVDGTDVDGADPTTEAAACRVYNHGNGSITGVPSVGRIVDALQQ